MVRGLDDRSTSSTAPIGSRPVRRGALLALLGALIWLAATPLARAQCFPVADRSTGFLPAALREAALPAPGSVRLTFLGHASFLIETAGGATAVTDYNGYIKPPQTPDIVTMNNAHPTHYAEFVEPEIKHVLRGWDPDGGMARHDLTYRDLHVRTTNVRDHRRGVRYNGNSLFVFEAAGLCLAHLGHLHHVLSDLQIGELGMIDVLLVPVDGSYTMAQELMAQVVEQIQAPLVVPMHYFNAATLGRFLKLVEARYEVVFSEVPSVTLSRPTLPYRKLLVLPGG